MNMPANRAGLVEFHCECGKSFAVKLGSSTIEAFAVLEVNYVDGRVRCPCGEVIGFDHSIGDAEDRRYPMGSRMPETERPVTEADLAEARLQLPHCT